MQNCYSLTFKNGSRHLIMTMLFCCFTFYGLAQNQISGVVRDEAGEPVPGANIVEEGTSNGTISDANGRYSLLVQDDATLVFSFIGYVNQIIKVGGRSVIDITLAENVEVLNEVVVIGYGTEMAEKISGSVSLVDTKTIKDIPQVSIDQLIQGRASGVMVTQNSGQPGSSVSVRIRGINSINGSSEPLYVIDGIPVSGDSRNLSSSGISTAGAGIGEGSGAADVSPLAALNPNDIKSVVVLKDASATAIYGSRGSNGVVLITTKKGQSGKARLNYSTFFALQRPTNAYNLMNLQEYATLQNTIGEIYELPTIAEFSQPQLLGTGTNWQQEIFDDAFMQNHQLSLSGGSEKHTYYISGSFVDQEGTILGSGFQRGTIRANLNADINDRIRGGFSIGATRSKEQIALSNSPQGLISLSLLNPPSIAVRNPDGSFAGPITAEEIAFGIRNPIAEASNIRNDLVRNRILGNLFVEVDIIEGLTLRAEAGGDFAFNNTDQFQPTFSYGSIERGTNVAISRRENTDFWILKQLLTYTKAFDKHEMTLLVGHEAQESSYNGIRAQDGNFIGNDFPILGTGNDNDVLPPQYKGSNALESYLARAIYSFDSRYNLTASIRRDKSSKFAPGNRVGYFPSVSASWRLSEEAFIGGFNALQDIKVFGGYGVVGNQDISNFAFGSTLRPVNTGIGTGFEFQNFSNEALTWESSTQVNAGVSFTAFKSKLSATIEVYNKVSKDFLFQFAPNDAVTGGISPGSVTPPWVNIGEMQNKGIDITLGYSDEIANRITWNSTLTVSHYKNNVNRLLGDTPILGQVELLDAPKNISFTREGQALGLFYGYVVEGLFRSLDDIQGAPIQFGRPFENALFGTTWLGDVKFKDINGDGVVDGNDRTVIGNPHPDFTFGFQNSFSWKNFDLSIFLQGSYGNDIFNAVGRTLTAGNRTYTNQLPSVLDYWSVDNPNASSPRLARNDTQNINISDRYVEDGSYVRIQNVTFGYSLPSAILEKLSVQRLKIYTSIQNLYTFTNYSGYDPEVGAINQNVLLNGIDNGRYPIPRTFTLGLNVEF